MVLRISANFFVFCFLFVCFYNLTVDSNFLTETSLSSHLIFFCCLNVLITSELGLLLVIGSSSIRQAGHINQRRWPITEHSLHFLALLNQRIQKGFQIHRLDKSLGLLVLLCLCSLPSGRLATAHRCDLDDSLPAWSLDGAHKLSCSFPAGCN